MSAPIKGKVDPVLFETHPEISQKELGAYSEHSFPVTGGAAGKTERSGYTPAHHRGDRRGMDILDGNEKAVSEKRLSRDQKIFFF